MFWDISCFYHQLKWSVLEYFFIISFLSFLYKYHELQHAGMFSLVSDFFKDNFYIFRWLGAIGRWLCGKFKETKQSLLPSGCKLSQENWHL